jgi:hypothetical protein
LNEFEIKESIKFEKKIKLKKIELGFELMSKNFWLKIFG